MEEFLDYTIKQLVDYPDEMLLTRHESGNRVTFHLRLRQTDIGKVIGKGGHTIAALRNLLKAAGYRSGLKVNLDIVEDRSASSGGSTGTIPPAPADLASESDPPAAE